MKLLLAATLTLTLCCSTLSPAQNFEAYFEECGLKGSITIFEYNTQTWLHSNPADAEIGTLPASTFKILHSLIALEERAVENIHDTIPWDGHIYSFSGKPYAPWNQDHTLQSAFKYSAVWYYTEIAKRLELRTYRSYLKACKYSNRKIKKGQGVDFWNYGKMRVTPKEQIQLLVKLYENDLPFQKHTHETVKEIMIEKQTDQYTLRAKTGWSTQGFHNGWYVGFVEIPDNTIFFATRVKAPSDQRPKSFSKCRKSITKKILAGRYKIDFQ